MKRQRGVALITVLLVVALASLVTAGLVLRQQVSIRSSTNQLLARQAWHFALGGEALAQAILWRDQQAATDPTRSTDHLGEAWARAQPSFALEQGELLLRIDDLAGRFNLNSLLRDGQANPQAVQRLRRLLLRLQIDTPYAERLLDWIDEDQQASGGYGAEDNQYLLLQPPYRAGNRWLGDVSELRLLLDMSERDYRLLLPHVSALPAEVGLNVNTASALLLSCLADDLDLASAQSLVEARGEQGFADLQAFLAQPALVGRTVDSDGLAVTSQYFRVRSEVRLGERRQLLWSTLQRQADGPPRVLQRDLGQSLQSLQPAPVEEQP